MAREDLEAYVKAILFTEDPAHIETARTLAVTLHVHEAEGHIDLSPAGIDKGASLLAAGPPAAGSWRSATTPTTPTTFEMAGLAVCVGDHPVGRLADRVVARDDVAATIEELA